MLPYRYRQISQKLIDEVAAEVQAGESVFLLAPRYGGKRYATRWLGQLLAPKLSPIINVEFLGEPPIVNHRQLNNRLEAAIRKAGLPIPLHCNEPFDAVEHYARERGKPLLFIGANVDSMSYRLARHFLEKVRRLSEEERLVAVLSGEHDFHELVHGPKSRLNHGLHYFLQNFALAEFSEFAWEYATTLSMRFAEPEAIIRRLWQETGGNVYLLRLIFLIKVERAARARESLSEPPLTEESFTAFSKLHVKSLPLTYWSHIFRNAERLIASDPDCWESLGRLLAEQSAPLSPAEDAPSSLEWAGVAVREKSSPGLQLKFSSPMIGHYIRQRYYNNLTRFGDLYGRHGRWDEAFSRYEALSPELHQRPLDADDRGEVEKLVNILSADLFAAASRSVTKVSELFIKGCRNLLGFRQISFWRRYRSPNPDSSNKACWELRRDEGPAAGTHTDFRAAVLEALPLTQSCGLLTLETGWEIKLSAAVLQTLHSDYQGAVVVSDLGEDPVSSRERKRLLDVLLRSFVAAHDHAVTVERDRSRLELRQRYSDIINNIFAELGAEVRNVEKAIKIAAAELRKLDYKRALFCLVDPRGEYIRGVEDNCDDSPINVAEATCYLLAEPEADIQPYVIFTRRPFITTDSGQERLTNKQVVIKTGMKALAIVPILNSAGQAIGTIHIERDDGEVPALDEVEDLLEVFGRRLAVAIEQSERSNLLLSALDKIHAPVLLVDALKHVRYANQPAEALFHVQPGWRNNRAAEGLPFAPDDLLGRYLRQSLDNEERHLHNIEHVKGRDYRGQALADFITDERNQVIGSLLHLTDLNYLYRVFEAFRIVAGARDLDHAMVAMLEAAKCLGHGWGRLWLYSREKPDAELLHSRLCYGMADLAESQRFNEGGFTLPRLPDLATSWWCLKERKPLVFYYDPEPDKTIHRTRQGLEATPITKLYQLALFGRKPGDYWLEVPLIIADEIFGNATLQWDEKMGPEQYELWKLLSELAPHLWEAFRRRDREFSEKEQWVKQAAENSMANVAHNISAQLAALPIIKDRYRLRERQYAGLREINQDLDNVVGDALDFINRAKEMMRPINPVRAGFDLLARCKRVLGEGLTEEQFIIHCGSPTLWLEADRTLLSNVLVELISNSKSAIDDPQQLRIKLALQPFLRDGQEWLRIDYRDNGPGIPNELKQRVFENFFSHRPGRPSSTGLGLAFIRRIVEAHGGRIWERGVYGSEARFIIELPRFHQHQLPLEEG
jgi:signal transduction histidine kinase/GAF domain-containing protein